MIERTPLHQQQSINPIPNNVVRDMFAIRTFRQFARRIHA
jgi:hypothetical protein